MCDYPIVTCCKCGRTQTASFSAETNRRMVEENLCFTCEFWTANAAKPEGSIRIGGVHYRLGPDDPHTPARMKGMGGNPQRIRMHTGEDVYTTDLWCQGPIPKEFKALLPDNADFIG